MPEAVTPYRRARSVQSVKFALGLYLAQLITNGLWSWLFFGRRLIGAALVDLFLLVLLVASALILFVRVNKTAGLLLIPYLLWICFASLLNLQIWILN